MAQDPSIGELAKLTVIGTAFAAVGVLADQHVPLFHKGVSWIEKSLHHSHQTLAKTPGASILFNDNPLTQNKTLTHFFAVNIMESVLVGTVIVAGGACLKYIGVSTTDVGQALKGR